MTRCRRFLLTALVVAAVTACGPNSLLHVSSIADDATAPPSDARLADAGAAEAAAWILAEIERTERPVVVKFLASWCLPCIPEIPVLLDAAAAHPDVAFLGVHHQDPRPSAEAFVDEHGLAAIPTLLDADGETAWALQARGMPSVAFIDAQGNLLHTHTGPMKHDVLEAWIVHLLGDGPRPPDQQDRPTLDVAP